MKFFKFFFYVLLNQRGNVPDPNPNPEPSNPKPEPKKIPIRGNEPLKSKRIGGNNNDLIDKFNRQNNINSGKEKTANEIEGAITFNLQLDNFTKENKDVLPSDIEGIIKIANEENYGSQKEKANAIKSAIIQSFFAVKENYDELTQAQKTSIDSFLKLTKNGREAKANSIYLNVFEPTLKAIKGMRKAHDLFNQRSGKGTGSQNDLKQRLMEQSFKSRGIRKD